MNKTDLIDIYNTYKTGWSGFLHAANLDMDLYLGAQNTQDDVQWADRAGRTIYVFNKVKRQVRLLEGYEIRNRHVLKIGPIGREDDEACRQHTAFIMYQMNAFGGYDILSEAFKWGSCVTGSNLLEIWRDRDNFIRFGRRGHNMFLMDPAMTQADLSDCPGILSGRWLHEDRIKALLPKDSDKIDKIHKLMSSPRWQQLPGSPRNDKSKMRMYEEAWRRKDKREDTVLVRLTGKEMPFEQYMRAMGQRGFDGKQMLASKLPNGMPMFTRFKKTIPGVELTIFVDGEDIWTGPDPLGIGDYPFVWVGGEYMPECDESHLRLQSFVRTLRDPQRARNRRMNQILDIVETQIQSYRLVREGSLVNPDQAWQSGQRGPIFVKKDAVGPLNDHFNQLSGAELPAGLFNILEVLDREETQCGGMNEEIFGSDDSQIPGVLGRFRTGQALTGQQGIFNGFRRAKRLLGQKLVQVNQRTQDPNRVSRFLNEEPVQGFYEPDFIKYDCVPMEGLMTDTQRQTWYAELKELRAMFPDMMQMIPASSLLENAPVQFPKQLMEYVKQAQQQAQQQNQAMVQNQMLMNKLMEAKTAADVARSKQEMTQAQEDMAGARLKNVKTLVETQNLQGQPITELIDRAIEAQKLMLEERKIQKMGAKSDSKTSSK